MTEKKYLQIYNSIKKKIVTGEYKPGEKLPSKRDSANVFGSSVITVETAYGMLSEEGYIIPKERSGYYVSPTEDMFFEETPLKKELTYLKEDENIQAPEFEYSLWFKTIRRVLTEKGERLFAKSPNMGCAVIRNAIADYLLRYRGMYAPPGRIIIGSGAEQLYETVVKILGRDKIYAIENPSYSRIEEVYKSEGVEIEKLKLKSDGISNTELLKSKADILHVTPFSSFPTGYTTSAAKKYRYLAWAGREKYIVEDDFNSEFFIPGKPVETLYSLDRNERVIYINTFSKSLSPSMRIGYMILPEHLLYIYKERIGNFSCSVPVLDQYVLAEYISCGNFERHLNRIRRKNNKNVKL